MILQARFVIAVPDLERSARFYRDVLGFAVHEVGDPGWRFFARDRCVIMAGECQDAIPPQDLGDHSYFAYLVVDDVDRFHAEIVGRGGQPSASPQDKPWGMREFGLRTADGHRLTFGAPVPPPGDGR